MRYWLVQIEFIRICRPANSHIIRLLERTLAAGIIIFFENPPEEDVVVVVWWWWLVVLLLQQSSWSLLLFSVYNLYWAVTMDTIPKNRFIHEKTTF